MPIPSFPPVLPMPIANAGDVNHIPVTTPTGTGQLSFQAGFPFITQVPLLAGGIAPSRPDFNAVMKLLSQHTFFAQSGGVYPWQGADGDFAGLNYLAGWHVQGADGYEYIANLPSGPDVPATGGGFVGPKDPTANNGTYWLKFTPISVLPTRKINVTAPLTGGGDLSADRTIAINAATESAKGVVELATAAETRAGTDATRATHPAGVASAIAAAISAIPGATTAIAGILRIATNAEVNAGEVTDAAVTPANISNAFGRSCAASGYLRFRPVDMMIQWGRATTPNVTFPVAFDTRTAIAIACDQTDSGTTIYPVGVDINTFTTSGGSFVISGSSNTFLYIVIGC